MKLTRVHIVQAATCGGLLDGLDVGLRGTQSGPEQFAPLCLVGPNGAGKSQFLQVVAEAFQTVFHACLPHEERVEGSSDLQFEIEYTISPVPTAEATHVRVSRIAEGQRRAIVRVQRIEGTVWADCPLAEASTHELLPSRVIGYTSGDNETLSYPFLRSRGGYAKDVASRALAKIRDQSSTVPDTRLLHIDYGTHLEVLFSNHVLGSPAERDALLRDLPIRRLRSVRCVVQLARPAVRVDVTLTRELSENLENLRRCSTCYSIDEKSERHIFDYFVDDETRVAFGAFWSSALDLYSALHKFAMLNDLALSRAARNRLERRSTNTDDVFAARLPEAEEESRIFRFTDVRFAPKSGEVPIPYVALSDGEHQLAQILGTMCMASFPNVLFLLDEPESHFNPQWRVKFISRLMDLPTASGKRGEAGGAAAQQDCLLTTHSPFVPSDMSRENVLIFKKSGSTVEVRRPNIETFGTTFDTILEECFDVRPPMSEVPRREIEELMASEDLDAIKAGIAKLGDSVEKVFLMDHLRQLSKREDA